MTRILFICHGSICAEPESLEISGLFRETGIRFTPKLHQCLTPFAPDMIKATQAVDSMSTKMGTSEEVPIFA